MTDTWVRVVRSDHAGIDDDVFVDGNYVDAAGVVGTSFVTETGQHTFETVDAAERPTWRKTQGIGQPPGNSRNHPVVVILEPA